MSIDRNLIGRLEFIRDYECKVDAEVNAINEVIEELTVKPERKTGRWIEHYGDSKCSECGYILKIYDTNYCPNCGADMRGEQNG